MFVKAIAALGFVASSLALSVTSPSPSDWWNQYKSNVINWSFNSGDPNPVDITVTNSNSSILNGAFSIARGLDASNGSFTVTNVTLRIAQGYVVNFVNSTNQTQIYASSQEFEVKPEKSAKSPAANATSTATGSSASSTSPSGSGNSSASGSGSGSGASSTATSSRGASSTGAAARVFSNGYLGQTVTAVGLSALVSILAACSMF